MVHEDDLAVLAEQCVAHNTYAVADEVRLVGCGSWQVPAAVARSTVASGGSFEGQHAAGQAARLPGRCHQRQCGLQSILWW